MASGNPSHHNYDCPRRIKPRGDSSDDDGVDLISSLPDEILQHILSFIPTKFAIRTSLLSRRWKKVWCQTPSLCFDSFSLTADSINETLIRYTAAKIKSFYLSTNPSRFSSEIELLLKFAISLNAEKLMLELDFSGSAKYNFPDFFYSNSSVKQLSLAWNLDFTRCTTVSWTSLKSLTLRCCFLSDDSVARILSGCPILESLTLSFVGRQLGSLHLALSFFGRQVRFLDLSKSMLLRRLDIYSMDSLSIVIVAPHIHYLKLRFSETPYTLVDVSSLSEADLNIWCLSSKTSAMAAFQEMLTMLKNVKKLTLGANILQSLSYPELEGVIFQTVKLETLTLEITIFESVLTGITKMLQYSPRLKKIIVHTDSKITISESDLDSEGLNRDQRRRLKHGIFQTPLDTIYSDVDGYGSRGEIRVLVTGISARKHKDIGDNNCVVGRRSR